MKKMNLLSILFFLILFFDCTKKNSTGVEPITHQPDLIGTALVITLWSDSLIKYSFAIKNIGDAGANMDGATDSAYDNLSVEAFQSEDTAYNTTDLSAGGTILGLSPLGILQPGQTITGSFHFSDPDTDTATYRYLILLIDSRNSVQESNETNNTISCKIN